MPNASKLLRFGRIRIGIPFPPHPLEIEKKKSRTQTVINSFKLCIFYGFGFILTVFEEATKSLSDKELLKVCFPSGLSIFSPRFFPPARTRFHHPRPPEFTMAVHQGEIIVMRFISCIDTCTSRLVEKLKRMKCHISPFVISMGFNVLMPPWKCDADNNNGNLNNPVGVG